MPDNVTDAVDRAIVNLIMALYEFNKRDSRKYVVMAVRELAAVSLGFQGNMPTVIRCARMYPRKLNFVSEGK